MLCARRTSALYVVRTPRKTVGPCLSDNILGTQKNDWRGRNRHYQCISGIRLGLQWKLRTVDKPSGFLVLKSSGVRFAEVSFRNCLVNWGYIAGIGIRSRVTVTRVNSSGFTLSN